MAVSRESGREPVVGVTCARGDRSFECRVAYARAVERAGGTPVLLPAPEAGEEADESLLRAQVRLCDAFLFTGGDDPRTEPFGQPTDPRVTPVHPDRQAHEVGLLRLLAREAPTKPVLGVCLGMQWMALVAGGRLEQWLPDALGEEQAARHYGRRDTAHGARAPGAAHGAGYSACGDAMHAISLAVPEHAHLREGLVNSWHRQAVAEAGSMRVVARAGGDGVIEAIDDPSRPFYVGVQWHPERMTRDIAGPGVFEGHEALGEGLFAALVRAAGKR